MHSSPFETPMGFHERYVVENKDPYLEGPDYFDEWDKALAAQGFVKQQRELYRQLPDYAERLGAFEWRLPEHTHPDVFVGDLATWWLKAKPKPAQPLFAASSTGLLFSQCDHDRRKNWSNLADARGTGLFG